MWGGGCEVKSPKFEMIEKSLRATKLVKLYLVTKGKLTLHFPY